MRRFSLPIFYHTAIDHQVGNQDIRRSLTGFQTALPSLCLDGEEIGTSKVPSLEVSEFVNLLLESGK